MTVRPEPNVDALAEKVSEAFLYVAPIHTSVVRDSRSALTDLAALNTNADAFRARA